MKYAHSIKLTVFSYEEEDYENILDGFLRFFPFNLEKNKIALKKSDAIGFDEKKIVVLEAALKKSNLINQFLDCLLGNLDLDQKNQMIRQAESRLDKNFDFFLRFDKDSWVKEKKLVLTDSGKCFHLMVSAASFPKKRDAALNTIKDLFEK